MSPVDLLNVWGAAWSGFMTRALVDASALLVLVLLVWLPFRRRISAQLAHGLFLLVLLKLVVPSPVSWFSTAPVRDFAGWVSTRLGEAPPPAPAVVAVEPEPVILPTTGDLGASASDVTPAPAVETAATPVVTVPSPRAVAKPVGAALSISACLMIGWACLSAMLLHRFVRALVLTRRLIDEAIEIGPDWLPVDVEALRRLAGVRRPVRWAVSPLLHSPAVGGLVLPTVVIPPDLDDGLTPRQLTWVLLHELAHVKRGDLWVVLGQRVIQALFFFHPAVHVANWIIDQLREYACDDVALTASKAPRYDCGEGFLTVVSRSVERNAATSPALGLFESRMLIRRRLLRIIDGRRTVHDRLSGRASLALGAAALAVLIPYGRPRDASARFSPAAVVGLRGGVESGLEIDEPVSYRPGEVWHSESAGTRVSVLALVYSPDGKMMASAGEDAAVVLRDAKTSRVTGRLEGHRDSVSCLAFSPDGKTLATAGYDRTVRLWDVATGRETAVLSGHSNWVFAVAFSADGKTLASAGHDKSVRLWDVATGRETAALSGHTGSVRALAFSPDGKTLASAGADRVIRIWNLRDRSIEDRLEGHKGTVRALAYSPNGSTLATAGEDAEVKLWDLASGRVRAALSGHADMVVCLAFSEKGGTLATGSLDATVKLWDVKAGLERASLQGHGDGVSALAFAPGALHLATAGFDGTVRVWEPASPVFSPALCLPYSGEACALAFGRDGRSLTVSGTTGSTRWDPRDGTVLFGPFKKAAGEAVLTSASSPDRRTVARIEADGSISLRNVATGAVRQTLRYTEARSVAYSPDGRLVASAHRGGDVVLWDARGGRQVGIMKGHRGDALSVAFAPDGRSIASAGKDGTVKIWNLSARRQTARGVMKGDLNDVRSVAYSPNGKTIAVADCPQDSPGNVTLWDVATRRVIATLEGHTRGVASAVFSPDGKTLASGGWDGTVRIWDVPTGTERYTLSGLSGVTELAFSPDGKTLASAGEGKLVTLWDVETGDEAARLTGFRASVQSVAFSPDGTRLATGGGGGNGDDLSKGEVKVWNLEDRSVAASFDGHAGAVITVAFSPDGSALASGGLDQTVRVWDLTSASTEPRLTLSGLPSYVLSLAFSRDGRMIAWSGRGDGLVLLHDASTGSELVRLVGHRAAVRRVAFAPDGLALATGGCDRTIRIWDVPRLMTKR